MSTLQTVSDSFPAEIAKYLETDDHDHFLGSGLHALGPLAIHASYVIGQANALQSTVEDIAPAINPALSKFKFSDQFENISTALHEMHHAYPSWGDREVYRLLIVAALGCFEWANIYVSETPHGLYVSMFG